MLQAGNKAMSLERQMWKQTVNYRFHWLCDHNQLLWVKLTKCYSKRIEEVSSRKGTDRYYSKLFVRRSFNLFPCPLCCVSWNIEVGYFECSCCVEMCFQSGHLPQHLKETVPNTEAKQTRRCTLGRKESIVDDVHAKRQIVLWLTWKLVRKAKDSNVKYDCWKIVVRELQRNSHLAEKYKKKTFQHQSNSISEVLNFTKLFFQLYKQRAADSD